MKAILPDLDKKTAKPLYLQLFSYIRDSILAGEIVPGEKLPSLRNLSEALDISLTTAEQAYAQLDVEGYIESRPRSGYFVSKMYYPTGGDGRVASFSRQAKDLGEEMTPSASGAAYTQSPEKRDRLAAQSKSEPQPDFNPLYDLTTFDFPKWKKCVSKVLTDHTSDLLFEGAPQGEEMLRQEISRYVYSSRGVKCRPDDILIAAGTQQITSMLAAILKEMHIDHVSVEEPGYKPVATSFAGRGFALAHIPVHSDGILIERLPANIRSAVYVNPSNQFPTGAVMPISRRYQLLDWADSNDSYIIEDDYDSELRYIGRPIPALQGLDGSGRVIYLGSFSSTLFASIKISYVVMPPDVAEVFRNISGVYTQTCSKAEQLALAMFMSKGYYQTGIKKLRRLNAQKLQAVTAAFGSHERVTVRNTNSGINIILTVHTDKGAETLCEEARNLGMNASFLSATENDVTLTFYYNQLPLEQIQALIDSLMEKW